MPGFCIQSLSFSPSSNDEKFRSAVLGIIPKSKTDVWYKAQKIGVNRIGDMMKRIVHGSEVKLTGKCLINHSTRETLVKNLDNADAPRAQIMLVTGHQNEKSLDNYVDSFSTKRSKQPSNIISGKETATSMTSISVSSEVTPLQDSYGNPSFVPSTTTSSLVVLPPQFPVLKLTNLAQDMENSTINITLNTNLQMPAPAFESKPNWSTAKRCRFLLFFDRLRLKLFSRLYILNH